MDSQHRCFLVKFHRYLWGFGVQRQCLLLIHKNSLKKIIFYWGDLLGFKWKVFGSVLNQFLILFSRNSSYHIIWLLILECWELENRHYDNRVDIEYAAKLLIMSYFGRVLYIYKISALYRRTSPNKSWQLIVTPLLIIDCHGLGPLELLTIECHNRCQ